MKRKTLAVSLSAILAASVLFGCGSNSKSGDTKSSSNNGLLQFEVSENVRLSVMDKIQNYYAPKLKAYYATL